jgi:hypothetical protein
MKGRRPWFDWLPGMFDVPVLGPLLYGLNGNRTVVRRLHRSRRAVGTDCLQGTV